MEGRFIVYRAITGDIIATDRTEAQARHIAESLAPFGWFNVSMQGELHREGGNVHDHSYIDFSEV